LSASRSHQCLNPNCCCCLLKNSIWHNLLGQCFIIAMENEANDHTHLPINYEKTWPIEIM
jgi:hypothetical protein